MTPFIQVTLDGLIEWSYLHPVAIISYFLADVHFDYTVLSYCCLFHVIYVCYISSWYTDIVLGCKLKLKKKILRKYENKFDTDKILLKQWQVNK